MTAKERTITVDNQLVQVSVDATVAEIKEKAKLPQNVKLYDAKSAELLDVTQKAPSAVGTIEPFEQG